MHGKHLPGQVGAGRHGYPPIDTIYPCQSPVLATVFEARANLALSDYPSPFWPTISSHKEDELSRSIVVECTDLVFERTAEP